MDLMEFKYFIFILLHGVFLYGSYLSYRIDSCLKISELVQFQDSKILKSFETIGLIVALGFLYVMLDGSGMIFQNYYIF